MLGLYSFLLFMFVEQCIALEHILQFQEMDARVWINQRENNDQDYTKVCKKLKIVCIYLPVYICVFLTT